MLKHVLKFIDHRLINGRFGTNKHAKTDLIKRSIEDFDWHNAFRNLNVNDQVECFNTTLLNIFKNFIPHETIKCSSKDLPRMNSKIKSVLRHMNL